MRSDSPPRIAWDASCLFSQASKPSLEAFGAWVMSVFTPVILLESKICLKAVLQVFPELLVFQNRPAPLAPLQLPFEFLHLQLPLYHAVTGAKGAFHQGIWFLGYGARWVEPFV